MLTQLVYTSRPRFDVSGPEGRKVLDEIARAARQSNAAAGISGVLLAGQNWLSQILEGDGSALGPVLKQILADERHEAIHIVEMRRIPIRHFEGWSHGVSDKAISDIPVNRLGDLTADEFLRLAGCSPK